jgi:hypothetical protein
MPPCRFHFPKIETKSVHLDLSQIEVKPSDVRGPCSRCAGRLRTSLPSPWSAFELGPSASGARTSKIRALFAWYFPGLTQRLTYRHSSRKAIPIPLKMNGQRTARIYVNHSHL